MLQTNKVRTTIELDYNGESKDLKVTFDVIDRAGGFVDWASIPPKFAIGQLPVTDAAKLITFCLLEAGFDVSVDEVYDDLFDDGINNKSGLLVAVEIAQAFSPTFKKKTEEGKTKKKSKAE